MALVRPRLTDNFGISCSQAEIDFAIPLLDEDVPLYIDPFLLWRSPSQQENALHVTLIEAFHRIGRYVAKGAAAIRTALVQENVDAAIIRLVGTILMEQNDEWAVSRWYIALEILARLGHPYTAPQSVIASA